MAAGRRQGPCPGLHNPTVVGAEGDEETELSDEPLSALESEFARVELGFTPACWPIHDSDGATYQRSGNPVFYKNEDPWPWHGGPVIGEEHIESAEWRFVEHGQLRSSARMNGRIGDHSVALAVSLNHIDESIDFACDIDSVGGSGYFAVNALYDFDAIPTAGIPFGAEPRIFRASRGRWHDPNEELLRKERVLSPPLGRLQPRRQEAWRC